MASRAAAPQDEQNKAGRLVDLVAPQADEATAQQAMQAQQQVSRELAARQCLFTFTWVRNDDVDYAEVLRRLQDACQRELERLSTAG